MDKHFDFVFDQIVGMVEPLTRFDKTSLKKVPRRVRAATGKAFWKFTPHISNTPREETGRLPHHAKRTDSPEKLNETAQQTQRDAEAALPARVQAWLRINERTDRTLQPADCFDGPVTYGYERICPTCLGNCRLPCDVCRGARFVECSESKCNGGQKPCGCDSGKIRCPQCGGKGKDASGKSCPKKIVCPRCGGSSTVNCENCKGAGTVPCRNCGATGSVECHKCKGRGYLHTLRTVESSVRADWRVDLKDEKREVVQQLSGRSLEKLRELASVTQAPPALTNTVVEREYAVECAITELGVEAAGETVEFTGFGGKAVLFDYKGIASILLEADLEALEGAVAGTPIRLWGDPAELLKATRQFVESEINRDIDNHEWLKDKIITADYADRAKTFLPRALQNLYYAKIGLAALVTFLVPIVTFLVTYFTGAQVKAGVWAYIVPTILAAAAAWILLERKASESLAAGFGPELAERVRAMLKRHDVFLRPRIAAAAWVVVLLIVGSILPLP